MDAHLIPELDRKGLRSFGLTTGAILAALFGVLLPWLLGHSWPTWPWIVFAVLGASALIAPSALRPVYTNWMRFGLLASRITTPLIMGLVFFLVISPIGLFRRLMHRDALNRSFDPSASTYRSPSLQSPQKQFERPF